MIYWMIFNHPRTGSARKVSGFFLICEKYFIIDHESVTLKGNSLF